MAKKRQVGFSEDDARRIARQVARVEDEPLNRQSERVNRPRAIDNFPVRVTSITTVSGRYPGKRLTYDAGTSAHEEHEDIWIISAEGVTLTDEKIYYGRRWGRANGRTVFEVFTYPDTTSLTVREVDLSPSLTGRDTIEFDQADGFIVSAPSGTVAKVKHAPVSTTQIGVVNLSNQALGATTNHKAIGRLVLSRALDGDVPVARPLVFCQNNDNWPLPSTNYWFCVAGWDGSVSSWSAVYAPNGVAGDSFGYITNEAGRSDHTPSASSSSVLYSGGRIRAGVRFAVGLDPDAGLGISGNYDLALNGGGSVLLEFVGGILVDSTASGGGGGGSGGTGGGITRTAQGKIDGSEVGSVFIEGVTVDEDELLVVVVGFLSETAATPLVEFGPYSLTQVASEERTATGTQEIRLKVFAVKVTATTTGTISISFSSITPINLLAQAVSVSGLTNFAFNSETAAANGAASAPASGSATASSDTYVQAACILWRDAGAPSSGLWVNVDDGAQDLTEGDTVLTEGFEFGSGAGINAQKSGVTPTADAWICLWVAFD